MGMFGRTSDVTIGYAISFVNCDDFLVILF